MRIKRFIILPLLIFGFISFLTVFFINSEPMTAVTSCTTTSLAGTYKGKFTRTQGSSLCPSNGNFKLVINGNCTFDASASVPGTTLSASGIICSSGSLAGDYVGAPPSSNAGYIKGKIVTNKVSGTFGDGKCRYSYSGNKI